MDNITEQERLDLIAILEKHKLEIEQTQEYVKGATSFQDKIDRYSETDIVNKGRKCVNDLFNILEPGNKPYTEDELNAT